MGNRLREKAQDNLVERGRKKTIFVIKKKKRERICLRRRNRI